MVTMSGTKFRASRCVIDACIRLTHRHDGLCYYHRPRRVPKRQPEPWVRRQPTSVEYATVHQRITSERGAARLHQCYRCSSPAREWAYDHADPQELTRQRNGKTYTYSADTGHYLPLCKPCHTNFDRAAKRT